MQPSHRSHAPSRHFFQIHIYLFPCRKFEEHIQSKLNFVTQLVTCFFHCVDRASRRHILAKFGAKPPSSPTAVDNPWSLSTFLRNGKFRIPYEASLKEGAPTGIIINSWTSMGASEWTHHSRHSSWVPGELSRLDHQGIYTEEARKPVPQHERWPWRHLE